MKRTGLLVINSNVAQLAGIRLARASANDPFGSAINFLANRGLDQGDFIWVTGTDSSINTTPVMFISEAGPGLAALAALTAPSLTNAAGKSGGAPTGAGRSAAKKSQKARAKKSSTKRFSAKGTSKKSASKKTGNK